MSDAKERITVAALRLFNERGYENVSLRDIAAAANMAIGTFTYHFAKKEDLVVHLLGEMRECFATSFDDTPVGTDLMAVIVDRFVITKKQQKAYPFYYGSMPAIVGTASMLRDEGLKFEQAEYEFYRRSLASLIRDGYIMDMPQASIDSIAYSMVTLLTSWVLSSSPYSNEHMPTYEIDQVMASQFILAVVPEHKASFVKICADRGVQIEA